MRRERYAFTEEKEQLHSIRNTHKQLLVCGPRPLECKEIPDQRVKEVQVMLTKQDSNLCRGKNKKNFLKVHCYEMIKNTAQLFIYLIFYFFLISGDPHLDQPCQW